MNRGWHTILSLSANILGKLFIFVSWMSAHIHIDSYLELLQTSEYAGWVLLEARTEPEDRVAALGHQRLLFDSLVELTKKSD